MTHDKPANPDCRDFLKVAAATGLAMTTPRLSNAQLTSAPPHMTPSPAAGLKPVGAIPATADRTWIAPQYWGNRLQDWCVKEGRIECVAQKKERDLNTVSLLTLEMKAGAAPAALRATTGRANTKGTGFSGFLLGAGNGKLDYRAAALVQRASGDGGGLLCVYNPRTGVEFREHTNEKEPVLFAPLGWEKLPAQAEATNAPVELLLEVLPRDGKFDLRLTASQSGQVVSAGVLRAVADEDILGGVLLVSAALSAPDGACFWFNNVEAGGAKLLRDESRALGPIVGALYSLNGATMKLSAQLMPVGTAAPQDVTLQVRETPDGQWTDRASAKLGKGYNAIFRLTDWDAARDWDYRLVYAHDPQHSLPPSSFEGRIRRDPGDASDLKIGLYSCTIASSRLLDRGVGHKMPSFAKFLGRYTPENICFPFNELVQNGSAHEPDMLFFVGDQFYEDNPSARDPNPTPTLDYLYKWLLWVWGFREMTRHTPTIVLIDDHDVYQPNLFGNGGRPAPEGEYNKGGYRNSAEWNNMVQRTQCGHNPDPWDSTPLPSGILPYYFAFSYGGVEFAAVEDRKWKSAPWQGHSLDVFEPELLGPRQEKFLEDWGQMVKDRPVKIVATETIFACVQTGPNGKALLDFDCDGYPALNRRRALELIRDAGALMISGDQHLATLIRNGIDTFDDGPVQFTGPAGSATWTRWFQPAQALPNPEDTPYTGDFIDAFGNKVHVMAVANPPNITMKQYWDDPAIKPPTQFIGDHDLKAERLLHYQREPRPQVIRDGMLARGCGPEKRGCQALCRMAGGSALE